MAVRVFIGNKIFAATSWRRSLRSGEACLRNNKACLRNGVEIFVAAYLMVGKGRCSNVGPYVVADQKAIPQKFYVCKSAA